MRDFFKFTFASCLGIFLALIVFTVFGFILIAGIAGAAGSEVAEVKDGSVLKLSFKDPVPERTNNLEMNPLEFRQDKVLGLDRIVESIDYASTDEKIKGIYIQMDQAASMGMATAASVRSALARFRESGKFIISYDQYYSQKGYYLASVSDQVYLNPTGSVDLRGFGMTMAYFKDMLDRVGVDMQVFYAGQFKSATEPYRYNQMSDQNRKQVSEFLNSFYGLYLKEVAAARNLTVAQLDQMSDTMAVRSTEDALKFGLVDGLLYKGQVLDTLRSKLGVEKDGDINAISLADYATTVESKTGSYKTKDKIAIVYAEGTIVDGKGQSGSIGGDEYAKQIRKIAQDDDVKAMVLRVNSGGGSGTASENILHEVEEFQKSGRPVIVSMGDYAASGGYYIACTADSIFADPMTLTGSIGVFGVLPNAEKLFNEKLGVHFDTVATGEFSNSFTPFLKMSPREKAIIQASVDEFYEKFITRVANGRGMTVEQVDAIAQGRVWTGEKATTIGLVDRNASMQDALETAKRMANIEGDYKVSAYPPIKDPIQALIEEFTGKTDQAQTAFLKQKLGKFYEPLTAIEQMNDPRGIYMQLPFITID